MKTKKEAVRTAPKNKYLAESYARTKVENGSEICKKSGRDFRLTLEYFRKCRVQQQMQN